MNGIIQYNLVLYEFGISFSLLRIILCRFLQGIVCIRGSLLMLVSTRWPAWTTVRTNHSPVEKHPSEFRFFARTLTAALVVAHLVFEGTAKLCFGATTLIYVLAGIWCYRYFLKILTILTAAW